MNLVIRSPAASFYCDCFFDTPVDGSYWVRFGRGVEKSPDGEYKCLPKDKWLCKYKSIPSIKDMLDLAKERSGIEYENKPVFYNGIPVSNKRLGSQISMFFGKNQVIMITA